MLTVLHLFLNGMGLAGGILIARRSKKGTVGVALFALGIVLGKTAIARIPALEANLFPWDFYAYIQTWWFFPFTFFLLGAGLPFAWTSRFRRSVLLVLGGLLVLRVGEMAYSDLTPAPPLHGKPDIHGICLQTTSYSCSAASAATFLHLHGIESTEQEMAEFCLTRKGFGGTTDNGILLGLRRKGLDARCRSAEEPTAPAIASTWLSPFMLHSVVLLEVIPDKVLVHDPRHGVQWMDRKEFMALWTGSLIEKTGN